jgi:hypothetical protein
MFYRIMNDVQSGREVTVNRPIPTFVFPNPAVSLFVVEPYKLTVAFHSFANAPKELVSAVLLMSSSYGYSH